MINRIVRWFAPVVPDARLAIMRTIIFLFVILDMHLFVRDTRSLSYHPELYQPLFVARLFHLPPPSIQLTTTLYVVLWIVCLIGAANRLPRIMGFIAAAGFTWWTVIGMSYGKVDHDHLALIIALWVLPTAGVIRGRWRSMDRSAQSGWALRCVQIAVVFTYFLSAITKMRSGDWSFTSWPNSAILTWAILRRPHGLGQFVVDLPLLLRGMQWFSFLAELSSIVILWLRGRALMFAALFWVGFHVATGLMLYIHFAPTLVCWLAFAPLERLAPWWRARRAKRAGRRAARHGLPVPGDQPIDGTG